MQEPHLAYRVRNAEAADDVALRASIGNTLAHPDHQGKRESYRGAASRGDLLVLEHFDRQTREWKAQGFVEHHLKVDDSLTIRDLGTAGPEPSVGVVRYLLDEVFNSTSPTSAQVKIRRDARSWLEIFSAIPGFLLEGEEYRRPHYWTVWKWDPAVAREAQRKAARPERPGPGGGPRPAAKPVQGQRPQRSGQSRSTSPPNSSQPRTGAGPLNPSGARPRPGVPSRRPPGPAGSGRGPSSFRGPGNRPAK